MIKEIVKLLEELSLERKTGDPVRDLYSVKMDLDMEIGKRMKEIRSEGKD